MAALGLILLLCPMSAIARNTSVKYDAFPKSFFFGVGTSAYQIEGAWNLSGKGESTWDRGAHTTSFIKNGDTGDIACDSYHKYREDIRLVKQLKADCYRFSLSWTRLLPLGTVNVINQDGIDYYNNLINGLIDAGIHPMITLFHWDTPQALQELGGWANSDMINWYLAYADKVFKWFGDRVTVFTTFNEPGNFCSSSYSGVYAPFINSSGIGTYECAHNILRAHAKVYHMYQRKYKKKQKGKVGITLDSKWAEPKDPNSTEDKRAVQNYMESWLGWFAWPIFKTGDYPDSMKQAVADRSKKQGFPVSRLPEFTVLERLALVNSSDFLGLNHYVTVEIRPAHAPASEIPTKLNDENVVMSINPKWNTSSDPVFTITPGSLTKLLVWIQKTFGGKLRIDITENGFNGDPDEGFNDTQRVNYMNDYIQAVLDALNQGVNVKSYTYWSLIDNFEWNKGYSRKFGLYHVDFNDPVRTRTAKKSAMVYQNIIATRKVDTNFDPTTFVH